MIKLFINPFKHIIIPLPRGRVEMRCASWIAAKVRSTIISLSRSLRLKHSSWSRAWVSVLQYPEPGSLSHCFLFLSQPRLGLSSALMMWKQESQTCVYMGEEEGDEGEEEEIALASGAQHSNTSPLFTAHTQRC